MNDIERKRSIKTAIADFGRQDLSAAGLELFTALGYSTDRRAPFTDRTAAYFVEHYADSGSRPFNGKKAKTDEWNYADLLFQLTKDDMGGQGGLFDAGRVDDTIIESYLFFVIGLADKQYTRTELAAIAREINKVFPMPVMVVFKHGDALTLAVIDRRINKRNGDVDVLSKVTLIKDICIRDTHRAHIDILHDLSLDSLRARHTVSNFVELHQAWRATLDISELNKRFYRELSNWYFWAMDKVSFPDGAEDNTELRNATSLIRLITRVIFVWFIREKNLIPENLFDKRELSRILKGFLKDDGANTFYPAILQNLFFATLNQKMHEREFTQEGDFATNKAQYAVKQLYRHSGLFAISQEEAIGLFKDIPFLNGGLFDCLDNKGGQNIYIDGFSRNPAKQAVVPDRLFFAPEQNADLNAVYGTTGKKYTVRGLIDILNAYKFTIAENTPIEVEVALDPELLGKVFENLLASYNPETRKNARNGTGSFYTPREIVNYMVDESLKVYLSDKLQSCCALSHEDAKAGLDILFAYTEKEHVFTAQERNALIAAIDELKILDPACGSGAFPMGILHKLVYILHKLDPNNQLWKNRQIEKAQQLDDPDIREKALADIESAFANNELDYGRKLYLIENCIYGVDIQPIAMQIAKLRFFIALVIDQNRKPGEDNQGIRSLPNLETKFVAADSLIGLKRDFTELFHDATLIRLEEDLKKVRHRYFSAKSYWDKKAYQDRDKDIRKQIVAAIKASVEKRNAGFKQLIDLQSQLLRHSHGPDLKKVEKKIAELSAKMIDAESADSAASLLSRFDPYDQNASSPFFDPEWMFGVANGFDLVIGNPPYIQIQNFSGKPEQARWATQKYSVYTKTGDIYCLFYERGYNLLAERGSLCYITSNKWMRAAYGAAMRKFFLENGALDTLIDFGDSPIFNATTYTNILLWRRAEYEPVKAYDLSRVYTSEQDLPAMLTEQGMGEALFTSESFVIAAGDQAAVKRRIEAVGKPLKDWGVNINRGILTGLNEAFIIDQAKYDELLAADPRSAEILKPILRGRDIKRYKAEWAGKYLIASHNGYKIANGKIIPPVNVERDYPVVYAHLKAVGAAIESGHIKTKGKGLYNRDDQGQHWSNLRDCAYWEEFGKGKVFWLEMAQEASFVSTKDEMYCLDTARIMTGRNSNYLMALLNSKFCERVFSKFYAGGNLQGDTVRYKSTFLENIPIPEVSIADQKPFEVLVDCIQFAREQGLAVEADTLEALVDVMVYGLYFPDDMKAANCYINDRMAEIIHPFPAEQGIQEKRAFIKNLAARYMEDELIKRGLTESKNVPVVRTVESK